jgi:sugar/nucleoside kinase (ribokinase family)
VHVGPLARSDFPPETLAELARGRRLSYDGQGLVRPARTGPLVLDPAFDPALLRPVSILKLSEEEAEMVGVEHGVPEVLVTLGARGVVVHADGESVRVAATTRSSGDPTGAGDMFAAAYLVARADGAPPVAAAERACAVVAGLLR